MQSFFGIEASRPVQIAAAVAIFLILLLIFFLVARKLTGARLMMPGSGRNRQPRIGIVDIYDLDKQRQLVLLRRDNVEHLLLIGGLNDVVIETNIVRVAGARSSAQAQDAGPERLEPVLDQAPRPQVESPARPSIETQLAAQLGTLVRRPAGESDADQELSPVAQVGGPASARPEPVLRPDAVTVSTAPAVQGFRSDARAPAVPSAPSAPEPVVERREPRPVVTPPPFQSRPTPVPPSPPAPPTSPAPPAPEVVRAPDPAPMERDMPAEKQGPDAAILSDMAKQLEAALRRPAIPVPPPPMAPAPAAPHPAHDRVDDDSDLPEPGPVHETPVAPREEALEEDNHGENSAQSEPVRVDEPPRPSSEPFLPAPSPEPTQPAPPSPARAAEAPAPSSKAPDPFSVEDIEAEFARLLGRPLDPGKKG